MAVRLHDDGDPVFKNYEDVFNYIVKDKSELKLEQAITLHLFHLTLRRSIKQSEANTGKAMSRQETDEFIDKWIGTEQIDPLARMAFNYIEGIREASRLKERNFIRKEYKSYAFFKNVTTGIFTNAATFAIAVLITFSIAAINAMNTDVSQAATRVAVFVDKCVGTNFSKPVEKIIPE